MQTSCNHPPLFCPSPPPALGKTATIKACWTGDEYTTWITRRLWLLFRIYWRVKRGRGTLHGIVIEPILAKLAREELHFQKDIHAYIHSCISGSRNRGRASPDLILSSDSHRLLCSLMYTSYTDTSHSSLHMPCPTHEHRPKLNKQPQYKSRTQPQSTGPAVYSMSAPAGPCTFASRPHCPPWQSTISSCSSRSRTIYTPQPLLARVTRERFGGRCLAVAFTPPPPILSQLDNI